jgi:hypothetical protein
MQARGSFHQRLDSGPDAQDRPVVEIVIAQDEVDRDSKRILHLREKACRCRRLRDVSGDENGVSLLLAQDYQKAMELGLAQKLQMNVVEPNGLHALTKAEGMARLNEV